MSAICRYSRYEPLFGSWYIRDRIGRGSIGEVYEIERYDQGKTYKAALKAITVPDSPDEIMRLVSEGVTREYLPDYYRKYVRSLAVEYEISAKLRDCSNIVGYEDQQIFEDLDEMKWDILIMTELLTPLAEHAVDTPLAESDVLRLGIDICSALVFCASHGIIHRDIKPENIFISSDGDYKLGDFGIARFHESAQVNMSRKGTYPYMAPEVFRGEHYDSSADLYSLGIVMYKYLNHGRIPFMPPFPDALSFDDQEKAFAARMSGRIIPDPACGSLCLREAVLKACAYDRKDRYRTAEEMLKELEREQLVKTR